MRITAAEETQRQSTHLAEWFDVRPPTVTDSVGALQRTGLVERHPVEGDGRRYRLHVTQRGEQIARELDEWDADIRKEVTALQTPAKGLTVDLLLQVIGRLQHAGLIAVARTCATLPLLPARRTPWHASTAPLRAAGRTSRRGNPPNRLPRPPDRPPWPSTGTAAAQEF